MPEKKALPEWCEGLQVFVRGFDGTRTYRAHIRTCANHTWLECVAGPVAKSAEVIIYAAEPQEQSANRLKLHLWQHRYKKVHVVVTQIPCDPPRKKELVPRSI